MQQISYLKLSLTVLFAALIAGCAATPAVVYVKEAQQVTTQALEPVMLESSELEADLKLPRFSNYFTADQADDFMRIIQTEIANTRRFTRVLLNASEGDTYIIQPRLDRIDELVTPIAADPTRNRLTVKARTRLDVLLVNQRNQKELVKSFYDERRIEQRISKKIPITRELKQDYVLRAVTISFRAASDQLGNAFNPSYEIGTISRINGRIAYVQINTSKLRKVPKKQQAIEVIDDDNQVLASLGELQIEDGTVSGRFFEKGGAAIKEGQKVRARINAMLLDQ
ncbi:hypothetical protein [Trichlorobacter sp.]|uniref:hypothetical protein n=1 Tax=Trichlorobacter sp. TaxID=2911007 RepID=UPI002A36004A|nr:hypothetical protein [Trichlorobacter sp.]MDY0383902.1 hypothetical protein [Trichlorobacter sp.]